MKVLYLKWEAFGSDYMLAEWKKAGYECVVHDFPQKTMDTRNSEELATSVAKAIMENKVDIVYSFNYFPTVAIACKACRVKYVSWTYDSPYIQLYSKTIEYDTNYAFVFDKAEYNRLRSIGVDTVYYLPMAAPIDVYDRMVLSSHNRAKYQVDIAMIGSMYTEKKHHLFRHLENLDSYTKGYIDAVISAQKKIYGVDIIEKSLTPDIVANMQKVCPMIASGDGLESIEWIFSNYFLARKLTAIERRELIEALAEKNKVTLYTLEQTPDLKVDNRGEIDYYDEAPYAIKGAKINLNITLRSILSGIPLRAFDIMGCGGFLLTNYQEDFLEFFEPDKDFVYFDSKEDLVEKADFYLRNESLREKIALSGYEKVKGSHTYQDRMQSIISIINRNG